MATSKKTFRSSIHPVSAAIFSLFIPGLGQFLLKKRERGPLIFLTAVTIALLINWMLDHQGIGKIEVGGIATSWLWLPFILFWIWNVFDAHALSANRTFSVLPGILGIAIILYVIAWQVTGVKLDRLVTRFGDAKTVAANLLNLDMITISVQGQDQICAWSCLYTYLSDRLAGQPPQGVIRPSENLLNIIGRMKLLPASEWQVRLGRAESGSKINTFVAGTIIETIAMGLMATLFSTILAIPVSFLAAHNIMSRLPGGSAIYYIVRGILNIVRAIDTIVWGLIVIVWVGLGSFAGVMALTIHSVAALGKLFSEEIEHIDSGPVEAITATGANLIQTIRFAVIPQIIPSFLAYSLLRWDINMRSATVVGFVAGGGIGFFVVETTRMGGYQQYATALWVVAAVIVLVDFISAKWREAILQDQLQKEESTQRPGLGGLRTAFYVTLGAAVFLYCWNLTEISVRDLLDPGKNFGQLILDFVSIDLSPSVLQVVVLDRDDPVAAWAELRDSQSRLIDRLAPASELRIEGEGTDLLVDVPGRTWINSDGRRNMPSGEVFTGPVSASGVVRFDIPSSPRGVEVAGVELELRDGEVVAARAERGDEVLQAMLATDDGARRLGEIGIGTNFGIDRAVGMTLLDEKIGGTVHLALGRAYPETGGTNESAIHWDLICRPARVRVDGGTLLRDGRFVA